jgi:tRNA(Arg) A34 adenosine deaminase TadA
VAKIPQDDDRIREVIAIAYRARAKGNRPFGALLVSAEGTTLAAGENSQLTGEQVLAHAEMNLLHEAVQQYSPEVMARSTLYTSAEPCAMCVGAIFWSGIGRLVFGISGERLHELADFSPDMLVASARDVLAYAGRNVEVIGPVLEREAEDLFADGVF